MDFSCFEFLSHILRTKTLMSDEDITMVLNLISFVTPIILGAN